MHWYLERWATWPNEHFKVRANKIEANLPKWGKQLYSGLSHNIVCNILDAWVSSAEDQSVFRRFTVLVSTELVGRSDRERKKVNESANQLLALPWELLYNGSSYLFQSGQNVRIRRQLAGGQPKVQLVTKPPIRILLVSPRPEDQYSSYIDHRVSARPLVDALTPLGELVQLDMLIPPTFEVMKDALKKAHDNDEPYHVVHFDGHGIYDSLQGRGLLCFEDGRDINKIKERRTIAIDADSIASALTNYQVPLFFLEACQSAKAEGDPTTSVAGRLLQEGVLSVVAMSHSVLVETARRFVGAFYSALMAGETVGLAVLAGQQELHDDSFRFKGSCGDVFLQDWFIPVLFQEGSDLKLIHRGAMERAHIVESNHNKFALDSSLKSPPHQFIGRSRELLMAERLLGLNNYIVLRGVEGEGKTTLAVELAHWLVAIGRFKQVAFISIEDLDDARKLLWGIGTQLVSNFEVEASKDKNKVLSLIQQQLKNQPTLILFDNMETVLEPHSDSKDYYLFEPEKLDKIFELCQKLTVNSSTHLIFTSREALPEPYSQNHISIDRLEQSEAIELVSSVLGKGNFMPRFEGSDNKEEIEKLVNAVQCHARALVHLTQIVQSGAGSATEQPQTLMERIHERYPDDREHSLFASIELSLLRLPESIRDRLWPLGLFHGGGNLHAIALILGLDTSKGEEVILARQLIYVGLATMQPYNYLRLSPVLASVLRFHMDQQLVEVQLKAQQRWCEVMSELTYLIRQQHTQDTEFATTLGQLELPNLLANLEILYEQQSNFEQLVRLSTDIEGLLQYFNHPRALARVVLIRREVSQQLKTWSHAHFLAEDAAVDLLLEGYHLPEAHAAALALLEKAKVAGNDAYKGAHYDIAIASFNLGRTLNIVNNATAALKSFETACQAFQQLASEGSEKAVCMVSVTLTDKGDCLLKLGRLDEALVAYEEAIMLAEKQGNHRQTAISKFQIGTVHLLRKAYVEALSAYEDARVFFAELDDKATLATAWHQTAVVYEGMKQLDAAEVAYLKSLQIELQRGNLAGKGKTLGQLGNLYRAMDRLDESVTLLQQAIGLYVELGDMAGEGIKRNNLASSFILLNRYDEARTELKRALECYAPYGHAVEPWTAFFLLTVLEDAVGNTEVAVQMHQNAIEAFLNYRRDGGQNLTGHQTDQLTNIVVQAIHNGEVETATQQLTQQFPPNLLQRKY